MVKLGQVSLGMVLLESVLFESVHVKPKYFELAFPEMVNDETMIVDLVTNHSQYERRDGREENGGMDSIVLFFVFLFVCSFRQF